jgi:hypothetical protein
MFFPFEGRMTEFRKVDWLSRTPYADGHVRTPVRKAFLGDFQIRKVQRRDCRGGGEESFAIWGDHARSTGCVATTALEVEAASAATAKLPGQVCASGAGASATPQHVLPEFETETGGFSAWSITMCAHSAFVCGVAHSLACECIAAQAETGTDPSTANPKATNKLRVFRIFHPNQLYHTPRKAIVRGVGYASPTQPKIRAPPVRSPAPI